MKKAIVLGAIVFILAMLLALQMGRYNYAIIGLTTGLTTLVVAALWLEAVYFEGARWRGVKLIGMSLGLAIVGGAAWPLTVAFVTARSVLPYRRLTDTTDEQAPRTLFDVDRVRFSAFSYNEKVSSVAETMNTTGEPSSAVDSDDETPPSA